MIPVVNPLTSEITEVQEPSSLDEVNRQIAAFVHGLGVVSKELAEMRRNLSRLEIEYTATFSALVLSSEYGEATQRRADAERQLYEDEDSVGSRRDRMRIEVKVLAERGHDYRACMNTLQTAAANLRAESNLRGDVWDSPAQRR